jgi:dihydroorotate dehydrogenase
VSLRLFGVNYGPVQCASGAMGWFGEGYWYHNWVPGLDWAGCAFVSKTTTLERREGNMPFYDVEIVKQRKHHFRPQERFPKSVVTFPWKGAVLNSVGLSGPGAKALFETGQWQDKKEPFFISFMSIAKTLEERKQETKAFVEMVELFEVDFGTQFGIQVNLSCPNTGHDTSKIAEEAAEILGLFQGLRKSCQIPIVPKFNVLYPVEAVREIEPLCDAICTSNTLPWGQLPAEVDWRDYSACVHAEPPVSPLAHLGNGGLSGAPLLPLVEEWVKAARGRKIDIPIIAGGGILRPRDVDVLANAGADAVFLGTIAILRGWRLRATIRRAHRLLGGEYANHVNH